MKYDSEGYDTLVLSSKVYFATFSFMITMTFELWTSQYLNTPTCCIYTHCLCKSYSAHGYTLVD